MTTPDLGMRPELLDLFPLSHTQFPIFDGTGAGLAPERRAPLIKLSEEYNPNTDLVKLKAYDARYFLTSFYEGGHTRKSSSVFADGVPRVDMGNTRHFLRESKAYVEDPSDGTVRELFNDLEKYDTMGLLFESESTNQFRRSSFKSGFTGVTLINANGGGQGTVVVDASDLLFATEVTPNSVKITALSTPQASDLGFSNTSQTFLANTRHGLSLDYRNNSGGTLELEITRSIDGWYYNVISSTWQSGEHTITLPSSLSRTRYRLANINVGGTNTTATMTIIQKNGVTAASQIDHIYHMQFEDLPWITSRMVCDGSNFNRKIEVLNVSNASGKRMLFGDRGTAYIKIWPIFDEAIMNLETFNPILFRALYGGSDERRLFYNTTVGSRLDFTTKRNGLSYTASTPYHPVAYPTDGVWITVRWCSSVGEWGLAPYTTSIFLNGIKGNDAVPAGYATESDADVNIGGDGSASAANMAMRYIWFTPRVHSDEEVTRVITDPTDFSELDLGEEFDL
jgi:hypothetical protein